MITPNTPDVQFHLQNTGVVHVWSDTKQFIEKKSSCFNMAAGKLQLLTNCIV